MLYQLLIEVSKHVEIHAPKRVDKSIVNHIYIYILAGSKVYLIGEAVARVSDSTSTIYANELRQALIKKTRNLG